MIGSELLLFIQNIDAIVEFMRRKFLDTPAVKSISNVLLLWQKITPFLVITTIENENVYKQKMLEFELNVKEMYKEGKLTILTKNPLKEGNNKTFYLHCLRFYIPKIVKITYKKHNLGVGIFTMQGFERRNKESKNAMRRFSNNRGNIIISNMKRLYDVFVHNQNKI